MKKTKFSALLVLVLGVGVVAAGCGSNPAPQGGLPKVSSSRAKPIHIIPTPSNTLAGTAPETNGTMWVVAGSPRVMGSIKLTLLRRKLSAVCQSAITPRRLRNPRRVCWQ